MSARYTELCLLASNGSQETFKVARVCPVMEVTCGEFRTFAKGTAVRRIDAYDFVNAAMDPIFEGKYPLFLPISPTA